MKYTNYLVQSRNISNGYTLGVEKYVRNVLGDAMSFQVVVVENVLSKLWIGRDFVLRCASPQIGGRLFEKMERANVIGTGLLNDLKIRVEVWISSAPSMRSECGMVFCKTERRGNDL